MRRVILTLPLLLTACGGGSSVAPAAAAAQLVAIGSLSVPGCEALIQLSFGLGVSTAACSRFSGTIQNTGPGCAANVRGTTQTFGNGQSVGSAGWTYGVRVRPGESIVYTGGPITVPTVGTFTYTTTPVWDNVGC